MNIAPDLPIGRLRHGGEDLRFVDLAAVRPGQLERLPVVLRLLLENVARTLTGSERATAVDAIFAWLATGSSEAEIAVQPGRVLMHDTTSTPALVDIAAMRDSLAEAGVDPAVLNPTLPVDVSVDHSLAVEAYGRRDAATMNLAHELRRNAERYRFLRWASQALRGVRIHPPGTGIMHTINLEQLATVVTTETRHGERWVIPDVMIGTDSHTPMVNGIGVLGWGVGGLEAQTVMFGMPTVLRVPNVLGVRLTGRLGGGALATDLALTVTQRLRAADVTGDFVEFFGPGVATLSAGDRAVVANMSPEYGATTGYFPIDERTLAYLRATGREDAHVALVEAYARRAGLWLDSNAAPRYSRTIEIDLSTIVMQVAGPRRPQDARPYWDTQAALMTASPATPTASGALPRFAIALAAITSCTNTTDPRLLIAAGLLARKARAAGLQAAPWVKTSLAPGSPAAARYLARAGLDADLAAVGFDIVGYGCTTCIGNSGPLPEVIRTESAAGMTRPVAVLSGNRNFAGRIHPDLDLAFIMSPALVVAFALAGDAARNLREEPVATTPDGRRVMLHELWPGDAEIDAVLAAAVDPTDFRSAFAEASANPAWGALEAASSPRYAWAERSTILRRPPFASISEGSLLGHTVAHPLLVVGDDVTTDHISPASAIPPDSLVADYLVACGDDRSDLNVFASRRGNWEVLMRATFFSKTLVNLLAPGLPVAHTIHAPSRAVLPVWQAAQRYRESGDAVVLIAGERYGTGSSRDWAAKGPRLLGIRAVLAVSFERIHRSNLIGMGILPLRIPPEAHPSKLTLVPGDRVEIDTGARHIAPRCIVPARILRSDGRVETLEAIAAVETTLEVDLLTAGGVIPRILRETLRQQGASS